MMEVKKEVKIEEVVEFLNTLLDIDPYAINALFSMRVGCNEEMANHPSVQISVSGDNYYSAGVIGVLNGLFGADEYGWGHISATYDDGKLINFRLLTNKDVEEYTKKGGV